MANNTPTAEQMRAVRHRGFVNSLQHMPEQRRVRLTNSYVKQDARRERNVGGFVARIRG